MTNQHPITPPDELVGQWLTEAADLELLTPSSLDYLATKSAQWGYQLAAERFPHIANQELEACCNWIGPLGIKGGNNLRAARRPKPSLKEQVSKALDRVPGPGADSTYLRQWSRSEAASLIYDVRRVLEALPND